MTGKPASRQTGPMRRIVPALAISHPAAAGGLAGFATPAHAGFNVCNKASLKARVAIGRFDGTNWTSMGWWTIAPKTCAGLLTGPLDARYYYLYATDGAAGPGKATPISASPPTPNSPLPGGQLQQARL